MNNKPIMNRGLKNRHIQLISLGGIIGSCYFLGTGYVLEQAGPASILAYLLGGIVVLCVMLCLAELAVAQPVSSLLSRMQMTIYRLHGHVVSVGHIG